MPTEHCLERLFLTGFRGTGKTTIAGLVAERCGLLLLDLDHEIQNSSGLTIAEIFARGGEGEFRRIESEQLMRACQGSPAVVGLGGGAILAAENRRLIKRSGQCVWLTASAETIAARIAGDAATAAQRPALTKLSQLEEIRHLLETREPLYREVADLIVDTEAATLDEIARQIVEQFFPGKHV